MSISNARRPLLSKCDQVLAVCGTLNLLHEAEKGPPTQLDTQVEQCCEFSRKLGNSACPIVVASRYGFDAVIDPLASLEAPLEKLEVIRVGEAKRRIPLSQVCGDSFVSKCRVNSDDHTRPYALEMTRCSASTVIVPAGFRLEQLRWLIAMSRRSVLLLDEDAVKSAGNGGWHRVFPIATLSVFTARAAERITAEVDPVSSLRLLSQQSRGAAVAVISCNGLLGRVGGLESIVPLAMDCGATCENLSIAGTAAALSLANGDEVREAIEITAASLKVGAAATSLDELRLVGRRMADNNPAMIFDAGALGFPKEASVYSSMR